MPPSLFMRTSLEPWPVKRGKVRDVYDLGDRLLMVSTDRLSAFDWVLPTGIPDKGRVLTQISNYWFEVLDEPNHLLATAVEDLPLPPGTRLDDFDGRAVLVRKTDVVPIECVVRGYLAGSAWQEYQQHSTVCGIPLRSGLRQADRLDEPIFTPATKAVEGHDENISFAQMTQLVGSDVAETLRSRSLDVYERGARLAAERGILIADTKFEWGLVDGEIILIDEVLTPDSSRFWPAEHYCPGQSQVSFDKQFARDWLTASHWDKNSPPPELPADVVAKTREKYIEAFERLTGQAFPWK